MNRFKSIFTGAASLFLALVLSVSAFADTYRVTPYEGLNVRTGPSTSYSKLGAIKKGTEVEVTEIVNGWGKITYNGRSGYISLDYAEKIKSTSTTSTTTAAPFSDGDVITFTSACSGNYVLDVNAVSQEESAYLHIWENAGVNQKNQQFTAKKYGDYWYFVAKHSGKAIDVRGGEKGDGVVIQQYTVNFTDAQLFYLKDCGNGYYAIVNKGSGKVIDVALNNNIADNGDAVFLWSFHGGVNQLWKISKVEVVDEFQLQWPVDMNLAMITQTFAQHSACKGLDIGSYGHKNIPIYAAESGTVVASKYGSYGEGNFIQIDHGNGYKTGYQHLSERYVSVGQYVEKGDVIGLMGTTGNSTGVHLHLDVYINGTRVDPEIYLP